MSIPFNFNLNMINQGFMPGISNMSSMTMPDSLGIYNSFGSMMTMDPIDSFCSNIMQDFTQRQNEFFKAILEVLNSATVDHTPEPFVAQNIRPYDYNKYGKKNGELISQLTPTMQEKTMQLLEYAKSQNLNIKITSGYRTPAEQAELRRKRPDVAATKSLHCEGKAVDLKIINGTYNDYKKLGDYAKSIGMRWGGDFKNPKPEEWHFDLGWS
ncbi:MAG: M15 family metallopeptidase [Candidatus Gastranaerophilaceae bacterium]|uniref:M15 family metallopeptidase n=1 Tax=Candidatus Limenecus avicola TaxID=2840847 RepID=A0A9D1SSD5_9CLOT|nr:phage protein [Clostridium sp. CAG:306]HIU93414.1 M15 family metallopeptidase [Candidatus Limenecus avicola]